MRKKCLVILLLVLSIPAIAFVQSASATIDTTDREVEIETSATEGLLPIPEYSGDWKTREFLSGDWGGTRGKWANKGLTFDFHWLQAGQGVVSGGVDEGWAYVTNLDYYINLDLMRMNVLPGALISFRAQSRFGATVNGDTGLLLPVNTYSYFPFTTETDDDVPFTITELNYTQFFSEKFGLLLGKVTTMNTANEFAGGQGRTQFMNFQFSYSAVFAQVVPYSTLAVGAVWLPSPKVTVTSMFMNTKDASTNSGFGDIGDGTAWWSSVDYQYRAGRLPGGGTVGFVFAFDGDFARIGGINIDPGLGISIEKKSEAWAGTWSAWQYVYLKGEAPELIDPTDGRQDLEGLGVFLILGLADKSTNPASFSVAAGLSGCGMIPSRGNDTYGLGYFYNDLQDPRSIALIELGGSTQGLEVYYNLAIVRSIALSFDFQWTQSAIRRIDDAIVLGARLNVRF
jgi:porin